MVGVEKKADTYGAVRKNPGGRRRWRRRRTCAGGKRKKEEERREERMRKEGEAFSFRSVLIDSLAVQSALFLTNVFPSAV